jgi:hypothetical protein
MTVTILSLVCIVLAALCLCLWVYASHAAEDAAEAMWEANYYAQQIEHVKQRLDNMIKEYT